MIRIWCSQKGSVHVNSAACFCFGFRQYDIVEPEWDRQYDRDIVNVICNRTGISADMIGLSGIGNMIGISCSQKGSVHVNSAA